METCATVNTVNNFFFRDRCISNLNLEKYMQPYEYNTVLIHYSTRNIKIRNYGDLPIKA